MSTGNGHDRSRTVLAFGVTGVALLAVAAVTAITLGTGPAAAVPVITAVFGFAGIAMTSLGALLKAGQVEHKVDQVMEQTNGALQETLQETIQAAISIGVADAQRAPGERRRVVPGPNAPTRREADE